MGIPLNKSQALTFYCLARQAERSIDFAFSSQSAWDALRQYYSADRFGTLESALEMLGEVAGQSTTPIARERLSYVSFGWMLTFPVRSLANRRRMVWRFSEIELRFLLQSFQAFLALLNQSTKPANEVMVETRMDFHCCEVLIERHLAGVPELERANRIEHLWQADHIKSVTMDEVVPQGGAVAARAGS